MVQDSAGRHELGSLALRLGLAKPQRLDLIKEALAADRGAGLGNRAEHRGSPALGQLRPTVVRLEEPIHPLHVNLRTGTVMSLAYTATGRLLGGSTRRPRWSRR